MENRTVNLTETLCYYDGPEIMVAVSDDGEEYICWAIDRDGPIDKWAAVVVSRELLLDFCQGKVDLRSVGERYGRGNGCPETTAFTFDVSDYRKPVTLKEVSHILPEWLPGAGFYLELEDV